MYIFLTRTQEKDFIIENINKTTLLWGDWGKINGERDSIF